ncbi:TetR/AcrR family transcriptional regulator C-terminal domain-containing protein [Stappia sp. P2PMeth1]|uniref:TetR/AcrR family transcriptional regulator C-terminal domain-containing protein n=1 Tax=Stappia sp. P2PMeth1 TaxID=2003586 RepID=UPI001648C06F|nr:TetR/AcrR family transcriptional regulator C-terminal domain-containing protein [Stappia sp. P2PMeth1]
MTHPHFSAATSPLRSLEAMFRADIAYLADHPNIPRMLLGALGRTSSSALRVMIEAVIQRYERHLSSIIEEARQCGEIRTTIEKRTAARLFIAAVQHLVFRALIAGNLDSIRKATLDAFESYHACMEANP